jgi:hypothetical protein
MDTPKNYETFITLVEETDYPPTNWSNELCSLWWEAKGNWDKAHKCVDTKESPTANRIHAYLHRKEGDDWNASYWYHRANQLMPTTSLKEEFVQLVNDILENY